MTRSIPILLYHHVAPNRDLTPAAFEAHLAAIQEAGYASLSVDEVVEVLTGRREAPERAIAITFDDGYLDNWIYAFPALKRFNIKATLYLVTARIADHAEPRREHDPDGYLSWAEARVMASSGLITFGSHTHSHRNFVRSQPYADIEDELRRSKGLIEAKLKKPCRHLAWPWGEYERTWWPAVMEAGYESAATTRSGANTLGTNPLRLQRLNVSKVEPAWLRGRMRLHDAAALAGAFGFFHGWDKRMKVWWKKESPYHD